MSSITSEGSRSWFVVSKARSDLKLLEGGVCVYIEKLKEGENGTLGGSFTTRKDKDLVGIVS